MADLLNYESMLDRLEHDVELLPNDRIIVDGVEERESQSWHSVRTSCASFIVRAANPFLVETEIELHLCEAVNEHKSETTWGELYGLEVEEVLKNIEIAPLSEKRQNYYNVTQVQAVVLTELMQNSAPQR
jgi:hypothetical protein